MKTIKVGAAILNQTPLDWDGNRARIEKVLVEARTQGVSVLCLPEMCICGYGCEDAFLSPGLQETSLAVLAELLPQTRGMVATFGLPILFRNALFNTVCVVVDSQIERFVAKRFLAGDGLHY
ncbi:MAG: hypothetical protein KC561_17475 [Myxococcales bacterium]|nr:hypothetical protein [Myxococcales bacterium]